VDLDHNCHNAHPAPEDDNDKAWREKCRAVSTRFLRDVLTRAPWREAVPFSGVQISGAMITGNLDLENALIVRAIKLADSRLEGDIVLRRAQTDSVLGLQQTFVKGDVEADSFQSKSDVLLRYGTRLHGNVAMRGAKIEGQLNLVGAIVDGNLNADSLTARNLFMYTENGDQKAHFGEIILRGARIGGQLSLDGATLDGKLDAESLTVGTDMFMRSDSEGGQASFAEGNSLVFARIGASLDLRGAQFADLDLSGANVAGDLRLGTSGSGQPIHWRRKDGQASKLVLRNAHVGNLSDEKNAWPERGYLTLEGFTFAHLGGFEGQTGTEMRERRMDWWDSWARLDAQYSATPYVQLVSALLDLGDRRDADEIRYLGRQRERETMWQKGHVSRWLSLSVLWLLAGYGIGGYTFSVLEWVLLFTVAGAALLWFTVPAARDKHRGALWCFGASLSRMLPVVEINKEFADFFNDPHRARLKGWQSVAFSILAMLGWVLGGILVAAMAGLTQSV
jgi:hypothetical protein